MHHIVFDPGFPEHHIHTDIPVKDIGQLKNGADHFLLNKKPIVAGLRNVICKKPGRSGLGAKRLYPGN
jgi:hypothetical protein